MGFVLVLPWALGGACSILFITFASLYGVDKAKLSDNDVPTDWPDDGPLDPPQVVTWPVIESKFQTEVSIEDQLEMESFIDNIVMHPNFTLEEKIAQMTQPVLSVNASEISTEHAFGPGDMLQLPVGSMLNGGGGWLAGSDDWHVTYLGLDQETAYPCPGCKGVESHASAYVRFIEEMHLGTEMYWKNKAWSSGVEPFRIPFMWATDAVHGHNNFKWATVFPHNVGLGAMRDTDVVGRIGDATAKEVSATGMDWTFAPCVTASRMEQWGRVYEGYSEEPSIISDYSEVMVRGIQGSPELLKSRDSYNIVSNIKHWIGDGGTMYGVDKGINRYKEEDLRDIFGYGYFSGLTEGSQVVMVSFNSWDNVTNYDPTPIDGIEYNYNLHGSHYIMNDVLKNFDGLIVSDYDGITGVPGCTVDRCPQAINEGLDIIVISNDS